MDIGDPRAQRRRIAVAIATRGRPAGLRALLASLAEQRLPEEVEVLPIVVVNGDEPLPDVGPDVTVIRESRVGIPYARNAGVDQARAIGADVLAFVDDDETMAHDWLCVLLDALHRFDADAVTGPVIRRFPPGVPSYIREHSLFRSPRSATGTRVTDAFTNNLLVSGSTFRDPAFVFDERLALTGGSDTELSRRLHRAGRVLVWVQEAAVSEQVPPERATVRWLLRRSFRIGANRIQRLRSTGRGPGLPLQIAGAAAEIAVGLLGTVVWPARPSLGLTALGRACRGFGVLAAVVGRDPQPYAVIDGAG